MSESTTADAGNTQATSTAQPAAAANGTGAGASAPAPASSAPAATSQQGTEGQAAPAASTEAMEAPADKPAGAPEKYEFKPPEGKGFDPEVISAYSDVAKELNLPQDSAQKILDVIAPKVAERFEARQAEALTQLKTAWAEQSKSDKEIGGEKLNENVAVAEKALTAFGTPELRELLKSTGLANHPEVIRAFFKAGKAISEDKPVAGGRQPSAGEKDAAKALYPNQTAR